MKQLQDKLIVNKANKRLTFIVKRLFINILN